MLKYVFFIICQSSYLDVVRVGHLRLLVIVVVVYAGVVVVDVHVHPTGTTNEEASETLNVRDGSLTIIYTKIINLKSYFLFFA